MNTLPIVTEYIPLLREWRAARENFEPGCLIGTGRTELLAIEDLQRLEEEQNE